MIFIKWTNTVCKDRKQILASVVILKKKSLFYEDKLDGKQFYKLRSSDVHTIED